MLAGVARCRIAMLREHIQHDCCVGRVDPDEPMALLGEWDSPLKDPHSVRGPRGRGLERTSRWECPASGGVEW